MTLPLVCEEGLEGGVGSTSAVMTMSTGCLEAATGLEDEDTSLLRSAKYFSRSRNRQGRRAELHASQTGIVADWMHFIFFKRLKYVQTSVITIDDDSFLSVRRTSYRKRSPNGDVSCGLVYSEGPRGQNGCLPWQKRRSWGWNEIGRSALIRGLHI